MTDIHSRHLLMAAALVAVSGVGNAAGTAAPTSATKAAEIPAVDPAAVAALNAMSSYLRGLPRYELVADVSKDKVIEGNGKLQFDHVLKARYAKGEGLSMVSSSPQRQLEYFYNHKQFTLYTPRKHFYVTVDAPATITATMTAIEDKYDLSLPLSDIFLWGTEMAPTDAIEAAFLVGPGRVNGQDCQHYAYRQAEVDWQLCIADGDKPLPLKLVITTTDIAIQPQFVATINWDLNPDIKADSFTFTPPADAKPIQFQPVAAATETKP